MNVNEKVICGKNKKMHADKQYAYGTIRVNFCFLFRFGEMVSTLDPMQRQFKTDYIWLLPLINIKKPTTTGKHMENTTPNKQTNKNLPTAILSPLFIWSCVFVYVFTSNNWITIRICNQFIIKCGNWSVWTLLLHLNCRIVFFYEL